MLPVDSRSLHTSIALHVLAGLVAFVGLPAILPDHADPTPLVMTVEVLPIGDISNVKPSDKQIQKEQKAPTPKTPKPVEPSVKEPPKEVPKPKEPTPPKPTTATRARFSACCPGPPTSASTRCRA